VPDASFKKKRRSFFRVLNNNHRRSGGLFYYTHALLSFSPLATLVGADSARSLTQYASNFKQSFAVSLAPVGALGMMATVCKGANLPGLKEMLGAGEDDINDAARELGCGVLVGSAVPKMTKRGGLNNTAENSNIENAACGIVRLDWEPEKKQLNFLKLRNVVDQFTAGTMSGRIEWGTGSLSEADDKIQEIERVLSQEFNVFTAMNNMKRDRPRGMIELHWPAPAMPLETNPFPIYIYGSFFAASFPAIAILAASPLLSWQSPLSSALLVGGQTILVFGHVAAQYIVKCQRITHHISIPRADPKLDWMMVDRTKFASSLSRRSFPASVVLSQHYKFKRRYVAAWHALLTMAALTTGFIAFYVGGKSSDVKTVVIYIALFILANLTKGHVVLLANKTSHYTLNNFGHENDDTGKGGKPTSSPSAILPGPPRPPLASASNFPIYFKFASRGSGAMDIFYFSNSNDWIMAAHAISKVVKPTLKSDDLRGSDEAFLWIPLYMWDSKGKQKFCGLLVLATNSIRKEDLFWSAGMEIVSILMDKFTSRELCSESQDAKEIKFLASFMYTCTRMLLSEHEYWGGDLRSTDPPKVRSLMQAIEATTGGRSLHSVLPLVVDKLNTAAVAAKTAPSMKAGAAGSHESRVDGADQHDREKQWKTVVEALVGEPWFSPGSPGSLLGEQQLATMLEDHLGKAPTESTEKLKELKEILKDKAALKREQMLAHVLEPLLTKLLEQHKRQAQKGQRLQQVVDFLRDPDKWGPPAVILWFVGLGVLLGLRKRLHLSRRLLLGLGVGLMLGLMMLLMMFVELLTYMLQWVVRRWQRRTAAEEEEEEEVKEQKEVEELVNSLVKQTIKQLIPLLE
jgi:hypothetical protein